VAVRPRFAANTNAELEGLVFGLGAQSFAQMADPATRKLIPALYSGRIVYKREPQRREEWQSALETAFRGYGDCEDLVAYRVGELRAQGILAFPVVSSITPKLRHVTLRYLDPKTNSWVTEDPSKRLGM
jgi:hypothetical protein